MRRRSRSGIPGVGCGFALVLLSSLAVAQEAPIAADATSVEAATTKVEAEAAPSQQDSVGEAETSNGGDKGDEASAEEPSTEAETLDSASEDMAAVEEPPVEEPAVEEPPPVEDQPPPVAATSTAASAEAAPEESATEGAAAKDKKSGGAKRSAGLFAQGRMHLGGTVGWSQASTGGGNTVNWFILGVSAGFYVIDGLEPSLAATFWIGDPFMTTLTPGLRYVFHMVPVVKPYVGGFYRHYFVGSNDFNWSDSDSLGLRGGVFFMPGKSSYVGGGVIYEHFLDQNIFSEVDQVYPEISFVVAF